MSSTERAPEPTMEEILASIRRIISDDEQNSARPRPSSASKSQPDDEGLESAEGEADDKIISDIARVLSSTQPQVAEEEEEDILDLTAELGGLEIVEEPAAEVEEISEMVVAEAAPAEAPQPEMLQPAQASPEPELEAAPPAAPEPEKAPEPVLPPHPMSASEEAASALERAIAALRAGQLPTSIAEFSAQPEPAPFAPQPEPEPVAFASEPEPAFEPEPETVALALEPEVEQQPEPADEPEFEPELVLTEFEAEIIVEERAIAEEAMTSEPESLPWESESTPWAGAPEPLIEPERPSLHVNGGTTHAEAKTLEDSVKDMLRPMLRKWLDENMARVLTAALKDELKTNPARFERD